MKILLVEDYSGVHSYLKSALIKKGHHVDILGSGDSFKKLNYDIPLLRPSDNIFTDRYTLLRYLYRLIQRLYSFFWLRFQLNRFMKYDIIQFMNYRIGPFLFEYRLLKLILENHKKTVLISAGCDYYYKNEIKSLNYSPCDSCTKIDSNWHHKCQHGHKLANEIQLLFDDNVTIVIPMAFDYYYTTIKASKNKDKINSIIPFPINVTEIRFSEIGNNEKLLIYHPLNRIGFKGTHLIKKVFEKLQEKYSNEAVFVISGKMPLSEYISFTEKVDIFVDQIYTQSYGMASVIAMAQGKVVLSGLEDSCLTLENSFYGSCPIINIEPLEEDIYTKLEFLILQPRINLKSIGKSSRKYVERYHDSNLVADNFIKIYTHL